MVCIYVKRTRYEFFDITLRGYRNDTKRVVGSEAYVRWANFAFSSNARFSAVVACGTWAIRAPVTSRVNSASVDINTVLKI